MNAPQPGWYQDPQNPAGLHFFDGQQWTGLTAPVPTDGQLTPQMIADSQQYMAAKFGGAQAAPVAPPAPTEPAASEAQASQYAPEGYVPSGYEAQQSGYAPAGYDQQPASFNQGYAAPGYGQPQTPEKNKTPGFVWAIIGVALVGIIGVGVWALTSNDLDDDVYGFSQDYKDLGIGKSFDCDSLATEVIKMSKDTDEEGSIVTTIVDTSMDCDHRSSFVLPTAEDDADAMVFICTGTATEDGGAKYVIEYEFTIDSEGGRWVYYGEQY